METGLGLSTSHNRSQELNYRVISAKVSYYGEGNLATVTRELIEKPCVECGGLFKVARWKAGYTHLCSVCRGVVSGGKRGEVVEFSWNSRKRLMRMLATLRKDVRPVFVTLTFSDAYQEYDNPDDWKRCLRAFEHRFRRAFPGGSFVWRLEVIDRKSGEYIGTPFPHFHMLVFGVSCRELRSFVPGAWYEVVGTGDEKHLRAGTQVAQVYSRRGIMAYASKTVGNISGELGKDVQTLSQRVGRWWGVVVRENFTNFMAELKELILEDGESVRLLRVFRRLSRAFSRDYRSLTVFIDGDFLASVVPKICAPVMVFKSYRCTGRRIDEPFYLYAYKTGKWVPEMG